MSSFFHAWFTPDGVKTEGEDRFYRGHLADRSDGIKDGIWAEWQWDGTSLKAENCRFGMMPIYYFHRGGEFCLSNSVLTLLTRGASRELDETAIAVFLRRQNFFGNDTPFKEIRCLPPNAKLTWSNGKLDITNEPFRSMLQHLKWSAIVDAVIELFQQSMSRRMPKGDRFTVPLSGGKDSRQVLFELAENGRKPDYCITSIHPPPRANYDAEIAAVVARRLDIGCKPFSVPVASLEQETQFNLTKEFSSIEHHWAFPLAKHMDGNIDTSYDGINVDCILYGEKRARLFAEGKFVELAEDFFGDSEAALALVLSDEAYKRFSREKAIERLIEELRVHAEQACPVSNFQFWGRTRRLVSIVPFGIMDRVQTLHTPFLDKEFFEFVMSVPEAPMVGGDLFKEAIAKCYPQYSDLPYADLGLRDKPRKGYNRRLMWELFLHVSLKCRDSSLIDVKSLLPRLGVAAASGGQQRFDWIQPRMIYLLLQLERVARGGVAASEAA